MTAFPGMGSFQATQQQATTTMPPSVSPKAIVYPAPELRFAPSSPRPSQHGRSMDIESSTIALINPSTANLSFKFKTNADKLGFWVTVQPSSGILPPEGTVDVAVVLKEAKFRNLAELKVVVETLASPSPGCNWSPSRVRLPCVRTSQAAATTAAPPTDAGLEAASRSPLFSPSGPAGTARVPQPTSTAPSGWQYIRQAPGWPEQQQQYQQPLQLPVAPPPAVQAPPQLQPRPPPSWLQRAPPFCQPVSAGGLPPGCDMPPECRLGRPRTAPPPPDEAEEESLCDGYSVAIVPYLASMLIWVGLGMGLGKGYFCKCE